MTNHMLKTTVAQIVGENITVFPTNEGVGAYFFIFNCGDDWKSTAIAAQKRLIDAGFQVERKGRKGYTLNIARPI